MANEVALSLTLAANAANSAASIRIAGNLSFGNNNVISNVQDVGTSAELLISGDVVGPWTLLLVRNQDTTNFVELFTDSGATKKIAKLLAGQFAVLFGPETLSIYAKADTATCKVGVVGIENVVGTLVATRPLNTAASGTAVAFVSLSFTKDGHTISRAHEFTVADVLGVGSKPITFDDGGTVRAWADALPPATTSGLLLARLTENQAMDLAATTAGADVFGALPYVNSFVFMPLNGTSAPFPVVQEASGEGVLEVIAVNL